MRASIEDKVLYLDAKDVPRYKKQGSIVRNSYFWALRSIAARSPFNKPWEFESEVWFALNRMLISFFESGYLSTKETQLEFLDGTQVPAELRGAATWVATFEPDEADADEISANTIQVDAIQVDAIQVDAIQADASPEVRAQQQLPEGVILADCEPARSETSQPAPWPKIDRQVRRSQRLG